MSALDRLREDCARRRGALPTTHDDDVRTLLAEHDAQRARAEAAEAECARLTTERDATRAEAAGLRAAIAAERAVRAAWLATLPACATAPADVVAAEAATGAALAGEGRAYLAAVEAFDGGALGAPCRASIRVDDTRAALVAALERCP